MACTVSMTQPYLAVPGRECVFTAVITNGGGSDVTVSSGQLIISNSLGMAGNAVIIKSVDFPSNGLKTVTASNGTLTVPLSATWLAPLVQGIPEQGNALYYATAQFTFSDASVAASSSLLVGLSTPATPAQAVTLDFSKQQNSGFAL